jgi:CHAT domain-containing protein
MSIRNAIRTTIGLLLVGATLWFIFTTPAPTSLEEAISQDPELAAFARAMSPPTLQQISIHWDPNASGHLYKAMVSFFVARSAHKHFGFFPSHRFMENVMTTSFLYKNKNGIGFSLEHISQIYARGSLNGEYLFVAAASHELLGRNLPGYLRDSLRKQIRSTTETHHIKRARSNPEELEKWAHLLETSAKVIISREGVSLFKPFSSSGNPTPHTFCGVVEDMTDRFMPMLTGKLIANYYLSLLLERSRCAESREKAQLFMAESEAAFRIVSFTYVSGNKRYEDRSYHNVTNKMVDLYLSWDQPADALRILETAKVRNLFAIPKIGSYFVKHNQRLVGQHARWLERRQAVGNQYSSELDTMSLQEKDEAQLIKATSNWMEYSNAMSFSAMRELGNNVAENSALLAFYVSSNVVGVFIQRHHSFAYQVLPLSPEELDLTAKSLKFVLQNPGNDFYIEHAQFLYKKLIAPLAAHLEGVQELIISTDGELINLPLSVLLDKTEFLASRYSFSKVPSARFIRPEEGSTNADDKIIRCYDPLTILQKPDNEQEILPCNSRDLVSQQSTGRVSFFTDNICFHNQSGILLSEQDYWTVDAIRTEDLAHLELIALSKCNDQMVSQSVLRTENHLSAALIEAGVSYIIQPLWPLETSHSTKYTLVLTKANISELPRVLQKLQIEDLKNDRYSHPYYWASYLVIRGQ